MQILWSGGLDDDRAVKVDQAAGSVQVIDGASGPVQMPW